MKKVFTIVCSWLGFILLLLSISSALLNIKIYESTYIVFYGISILGLIIGLLGWILLKFNVLDSKTRILGNIGFYGNFIIVVLFYPPIYEVWGKFIFGS